MLRESICPTSTCLPTPLPSLSPSALGCRLHDGVETSGLDATAFAVSLSVVCCDQTPSTMADADAELAIDYGRVDKVCPPFLACYRNAVASGEDLARQSMAQALFSGGALFCNCGRQGSTVPRCGDGSPQVGHRLHRPYHVQSPRSPQM